MLLFQNDVICLRSPEPSDIDLLYLWENDAEVRAVGDSLTPYSRKQLKEYLESEGDLFANRQLRLMIELKETAQTPKETIGTIDLFDFNPYHRRAGVGILIFPPRYRKKGYAIMTMKLLINFAFIDLELHQLYASAPASNASSKIFLEKCGFQQCAQRKDWLRIDGQWVDEVFYQLFH